MRALWIRLHLLAASFVSAILLMIAISGGLYLFGEKGTTVRTDIEVPEGVSINPRAESLQSEVASLLRQSGESDDFEYIKQSGMTLITRPTSKTYYVLDLPLDTDQGPSVTKHEPDWIKTIVELHKGHGPMLFKRFQQLTAGLLIFILLSGLWLGVSAKGLRTQSLGAAGLGFLVFLILAFV